jgi:non-haem Fe2+, alpha-ketoglutarate-dependent halogenase
MLLIVLIVSVALLTKIEPKSRCSTRQRKGLHTVERFVYDVATHPQLLAYVEAIIGPNILLWGSNIFCKQAKDEAHVAWHQDAKAWPLSPDKTVTAWLAIDDVDETNGAMQVIAGSHTQGHFQHGRGATKGNMLDKSLSIVDETLDFSKASTITLKAGEASIHHANLVHGSSPNRSTSRRCGLAIRYMPPDVKKVDPNRWPDFSTVLVRGVDPFLFSPKSVLPLEFLPATHQSRLR